MKEAKKQAQIVSVEVNKRPLVIVENAITFLSSMLDGSASRYGIQNRITVVSGARKIVAKHKMMEMVRDKIEVTKHKVRGVISRGLPFF